jgi:hypothetical protein
MKSSITSHTTRLLFVLIVISLTAPVGIAQSAFFEETHAVPMPMKERGAMGDLLQLNYGSVLFSYTGTGGLMAIKSTDQGQTWSNPWMMISQPSEGYISHPSFLRLQNDEILPSYTIAPPAMRYIFPPPLHQSLITPKKGKRSHRLHGQERLDEACTVYFVVKQVEF